MDAGVKAPRGFVPPAKIDKNPRLQSQLAAVADAARQQGPAAGLQSARIRGLETAQGKVRVIVEGASSVARSAVVAQGGSVEATAGRLTEALVPATAVTALSRAAGVEYVRAPLAFRPLATESEGVAASDANDWHAVGAEGSGAKVAIIDLGFGNLSNRQLSGDLPAVTTVDHCGSMGAPEQHGTAVAEIVHEMAPEAQLYLICIDSEVDLANALTYVKANGIKVVNHSVGWYNSSRGDGTGAAGTPDAIVADARANGILWVNSAGNAAQEHWSGNFTDANADGIHEFAGADDTNSLFLFSNEVVCGFLKWDAWPATNQDFDLYLLRSSDFEPMAWSLNDQAGHSLPPTEEFCYMNSTGAAQSFSFVIDRFSASTAPRFDLFVTVSDALEHQTAAGSITEPATAPGAFAVGAICWQNNSLEPYSSLGPTIDGRTKPDIAGQSAVSSGIYGSFAACGSSGFTGTSSAAPHVAGAAALLKGMFPLATVSELQAWLEADALDLGAAGKDSSTGAGKLRLPVTPPSAPTTSAPAPGPEDTTYQSFEVAGNTASGGITTSYYWEYGETTSYGSQTTPVALASPSRTGQAVDGVLTGLNAGTEYHYRLVSVNPFGSTPGEDRTQSTAPALAPGAVTEAPQEIGANAARLDGSVTPNTAASTAKFEWGTTTAYGNETPVQSAGTFGTNGVVAEISGLAPNTEYHYRIVASNVHGPTQGADLTFTTAAGGEPTGVTGTASGLSTTQATVAADITPNGLATTYQFEYGTSPTGTLQLSAPGQAGYGTSSREVTSTLTALQPGTEYSYRVVATNSLGTSTGEFATFTTVAAPPPPSGGGGGGGGGSADPGIQAPPVVAPLPPAPPRTPTAVATKTGNARANTIRGTARAETIRGLGGNDRLYGAGGNDRVFGDAGADLVYGDAGADRVYGGSGNDRLFGGTGRDLFEGGAGNDVISARDRTRDTIRCGAGRDTVTADRTDAVARDCERVTRR